VTPETFLKEFGVLAETEGGIERLREATLHLATRGLLLPQNPTDEPATDLLERVRLARRDLGLAQEEHLTGPVKLTPWTTPENWTWCHWQDIALRIGDIDHKMPDEQASGIPYVSPRDFRPGNVIDFEGAKKVSRRDYDRLSAKIRPEQGDIIFPRYGTIGENRLVTTDREFLASYSCAVIKLFPGYVEARYAFYYSISPLVKSEIARYVNRTTQGNIGIKSIKAFLFPLPPLPEQKRIVKKVDELMALCDELQAKQEQKRSTSIALNKSALSAVITAPTPSALKNNWERVQDHFEILYDCPQNVQDLRQTILELAVTGKLVKQDPNYDSSQNTVVGDFLALQNGYAFKSGWFVGAGVRLVRNANVGHGRLDWTDIAAIDPGRESEFERFRLNAGDIVLSLDRPLINTGIKVARVCQSDLPCLLLQRVGCFRLSSPSLSPDFFFLWLQSPTFKEAIDPGRSKGVPHISSKQVEAIPFAPPPLAQQEAAVHKVKQLMPLLDELEATLRRSRSDGQRLYLSAITNLIG
jgi:type I restriction enzyme, S subunit